jgi:hypothetical protein
LHFFRDQMTNEASGSAFCTSPCSFPSLRYASRFAQLMWLLCGFRFFDQSTLKLDCLLLLASSYFPAATISTKSLLLSANNKWFFAASQR